MDKAIRTRVYIIGSFSLVFSILGLSYNYITAFQDYAGTINDRNLIHFYPIFYIMSGVCVIFYMALGFCGIQLLRLKVNALKYLIWSIVMELVYLFCLVGLFLNYVISQREGMSAFERSLSGAFAAANGGLGFQLFTLFPIWGALLSYWCLRRENSSVAG